MPVFPRACPVWLPILLACALAVMTIPAGAHADAAAARRIETSETAQPVRTAQDLPPALAARFSEGVAALKAGQLGAAEAAFREVLRGGGARAFVHHNLGLVLRERGRHAEALAAFQAAARLDPSFGPGRLFAGMSLLTLGRPREAVAPLERAVQLMPREIVAHLQLADAYERTDAPARLVDTYRTIVALAPGDSEYVYRLGRAYLKLSQWAQARLVTLDPAAAARVTASLQEAGAREGEASATAPTPAAQAEGTRAAAGPTTPSAAAAPVTASQDPARTAAGGAPAQTPHEQQRQQEQVADVPQASDTSALRVPARVTGRTDIEAAIQQRAWDRAARLLATEIERAPAASSDLLILLARVFMLDRKPLNAAVAIKKAEALGPIDDRTRFTLALAYIALGRRDWAAPELERLAKADASNVTYSYWLARLDYDAGQYDAAIRRLKEVVARDPRFMRAYDNLGLCYEAQNQPDQAIVHYREAIRLNREAEAAARSPWPPLNLGLLLRQRGEMKEAESLFREAIGYDAPFARAHYELGTLLEQQGQTTGAVAALTRAAEADPAYAEPHYALSRIHRRLGRSADAETALATFQRLRDAREASNRPAAGAVVDGGNGAASAPLTVSPAASATPHPDPLPSKGRGDPSSAPASGMPTGATAPPAASAAPVLPVAPTAEKLIELARTAYKDRDLKGALGYLAHARDLEPQNAGVHFFFGIVCIELNLGREAYESLKKAVALQPGNPFMNYALGATAIHRHEPSEALPYFEAYVRLRPDDPRGRFALGAAHFYSHQFDEARVELEQATAHPETAAGANYFLARVARQLNDLPKARQALDRALQANPKYADAWAELGLVQLRSDQFAEAEQSLAKAIAIEPENYQATMNLATLYSRTKDPRREAQVARLAAMQAKRESDAQDFLRIVQVVP